MASDQPSTLTVDGLTVEFATERGPVTVVRDVSFELRSGETLGLVGESGSGKTVTALALMGLLAPTARIVSGSARVSGQQLIGRTQSELRELRGRDIAMIFQEPRRSLDPCFTVGDHVMEAVRAHRDVSRREAREIAIDLLDQVHIPNPARRARSYPHELSGGQCQRVMIAVAIACSPKVLLADEPTTALDVTVQAAVFDLLAELQQRMDLAILLVTHDLGVVAETCDRVSVMYAGEIVEQASVYELFEGPRHPYTRGLMRSAAVGRGAEMVAIPGMVPPAHHWPTGCRFHPRCDVAQEACAHTEPAPVRISSNHTARCVLVTPDAAGDAP